MNVNIQVRVLKEARYMVQTKATVRDIANYFDVSKSTVHKDLSERLKDIDEDLFEQVEDILKQHYQERHIRGGEVTKQRYKKEKKVIK
ncbi:MAG: sporulation transcriptional regulator SpoIIID [Bacilli bacterium]|nr:sporulation transcriptional regulator SpoIIID [Bacilli bacterium]